MMKNKKNIIGSVEELSVTNSGLNDIIRAVININTIDCLHIGSEFMIGEFVFTITKIEYRKIPFLSMKSGLYAIGICKEMKPHDHMTIPKLYMLYNSNNGKAYKIKGDK